MLQRKIFSRIEAFYKNSPTKALMITGARQVGKSYVIERFGKTHYKHFLCVDFIAHPEYVELFRGAHSAADVLLRLSTVFGDEMVKGQTLVFFDEVQECKELITQIKYLVEEGSYSYILSGSLLGTVLADVRSVPVGYLDIMRMYPLDFEEFARANGVADSVISSLRKSFLDKKPVDPFVHQRMMALFDLYMIVGGMPAAVSCYLRTKNLSAVWKEQTAILSLYKSDVAKYDKEEKLYLQEIFDLLPSELNAKNKRFILKNLNENAKFARYDNSFLWLKNAGVALPCHVAEEPKIPLLLSKSTNLFKLFLCDCGLLASEYGAGIQIKILNHETDINFGSVYENVAAQELQAHGFTLYYFNSKKQGEIDFLIEDDGCVIPLEIKSGKNYYRHQAMDNVLSCAAYDLPRGMVFSNGNVETDGKTEYYPVYMIMFLQKTPMPETLIYDTDFSDLNATISEAE